MSGSLTLPSPAKLNLFLHITGRRADGYHELQTVFQLLDWGDRLHFEADDSGELCLEGPDLGVPTAENLVMRAARALQRPGLGARIRLDKQIPTGGGLGGGSSNAATTLLALNRLWRLGLEPEELARIGAGLGADVPVFVAGHSAWGEGVGERLQSLELAPSWYLVVHPGCHISTAEIFSHPELTRTSSPITIAAFFAGHSRNDCCNVVVDLYPEVANALNWLENFGEAQLTGTGACVFTRFQEEAAAREAASRLPTCWRGFVARGVNRSPTHRALD